MDILNIAFGVVGILSFGYAVWQNRAAVNARKITVRVTSTICQLGREMTNASLGTSAEGYARSIVQIAESLLDDPDGHRRTNIGVVQVEYTVLQFRTRIGRIEPYPDSVYGYVCIGEYSGEPWSEDSIVAETGEIVPPKSVLIYGPYRRLPVSGRYRAEFRVKRGNIAQLSSRPLVRLDVYDHENRRTYGILNLSIRSITLAWQDFKLEFDYPNTSNNLEYRVAVMEPGIEIMFELVSVELVNQVPVFLP